MFDDALEIVIVGMTASGHTRDFELTRRPGRKQRRPEDLVGGPMPGLPAPEGA